MKILAPGVEELVALPTILIDGYVIPREGYTLFENGAYENKVPLIIGNNRDEVKFFLGFVPDLPWESELSRAAGKYGSLLFKAKGVDELAQKLSDVPGQPPVYAYQFSWGSPDKEGNSTLPGENGKKLGAFFALEIPFFLGTDIVFNNFFLSTLFTRKNQAGRKALSAAMMQYVSAFARTGKPDPGNPALPEWKPWSNLPGAEKYIVFDADNKTPVIGMSAEEVTRESIYKRMKDELAPSLYYRVHELVENLVE